jgi:very-short-patch-repair endonuclease
MILIRGKLIDEDTFKRYVAESKSKIELTIKLGIGYSNGSVNKQVMDAIEYLRCSIDHFDSLYKNKLRRKYEEINKNCPICQKQFTTQKNHPKEKTTCSNKCSNTYFSEIRHTPESKQKVSLANHKRYLSESCICLIYIKNCKYCNNSFCSHKKNTILCSASCSAKYKWTIPGYREKQSSKAKERVANGTHKGWTSREKIKPSFAEKVTMEILNELNINYKRELKVNKWFVDFADDERKLALEIDGKQHDYPERKASDDIKDKYLISNGWQVLRIKWQRITPEFRNEVKQKINVFFNKELNEESHSTHNNLQASQC